MSALKVLAVCALFGLAAGCGSNTGGAPAQASSTTSPTTQAEAADPFSAFDVCRDLSADFLQQRTLRNITPSGDEHTSGDLRWKGCRYQKSNDFTVGVEVSNMTIAGMDAKHDGPVRHLQIAGRESAADGPDPQYGDSCTLLVAMKGGGLWFAWTNSGHPAIANPCDGAVDFASKVVPMLPAGS